MAANPRVFFGMAVGGTPVGWIVMKLLADVTPRTAEKFRALCTGEKGDHVPGRRLHHRSFTIGNDMGGESIYDSRFADENTGLGILSMANADARTKVSQFFIYIEQTSFLDGKHMVFGQVVEGMEFVREIEKVRSCRCSTSKQVVI